MRKKKIKPLIDRFLHVFAKCRKSVEKTIHQKKNRGQRTPRPFKAGKAIEIAVYPITVHFNLLLRSRSMHDVAWEFAPAVKMRKNN